MPSKPPAIAPARFFAITAVFTILSLIILLNLISIKPALNQLLDFGSFVAAGRQAASGGNPYDSDSPLVYRIESQETGQALPSPNLNPPISVLFFRGIAKIEPMRAVSVWRILSAVLFLAGIGSLGWFYRSSTTPLRILWAISLAGFWNTIALGQIYAPIFILVIAAWLLLEHGRTIAAGVALGVMIAIKPNFAFWLALLGLAGYPGAIWSAVITALVLSILPSFVFGIQIYQQWIAGLLAYPTFGLTIAGNSSLASLAARLGAERFGIALSVVLAGLAAYFVYRNRNSLGVNEVNSLGILGSILISPFSWAGYGILTLPIFLSKAKWNWLDKLAAACLAFPYVLILYLFRESVFNSILFGWLYGWGLLLIVAGMLVDRQGSQPANFQRSRT